MRKSKVDLTSAIFSLSLWSLLWLQGTSVQAAEAIALDALFSQANFISPALSPQGDKLAFIAMIGEHQVIGIRPVDGNAKPKLIGRNSDTRVRWQWLGWANQERLLVSSEQLFRSQEMLTKTRFRATRLMGIDEDGKNDLILGRKWPRASFTPIQYQDRIIDWQRDNPKKVLMQIRELDKRHVSPYEMDVRSGAIRQVDGGHRGVNRLYTDGAGQLRAGSGLMSGFVARVDDQQDYTVYKISRSDDEGYLGFAGFSADKNLIYVYDTVDGFTVLRRFDLNTGKVSGDPMGAAGYDIGATFEDPRSGNVIGFSYVADHTELVWIDDVAEQTYKPLLDALPGSEKEIVSVSANGRRAIVRISGDTLPPHYYLIDNTLDDTVYKPLGRAYPALADTKMVPSKAVRYQTSDGWQITGYLTLPATGDRQNLPTVVMPHGGPAARDSLEYDQRVQFLASRGYAVFRMNFRGSSGYGAAFSKPAYRQWGMRMQDDITEGVQWLIDQGIADPQRIAIFGASYGGYAALMGGVRTPNLYKAIISYAGVTHLPWLENEADESLRAAHRVFKEMSSKELLAISPAEQAEKFSTAVLLGHGVLDNRVNVRHSRRMAKALKAADAEVEYLEFDDEIHGFLLQGNRLSWYQAIEAFLAKHLAARTTQSR